MTTIEFVDQSLRDGQQSLWGTRRRAGNSLPIAAGIDRVGYRIEDFTGSSLFEVLVRYCRENPWDGLDLVRAAMPYSRMRARSRAQAIVGMGLTPNAILELWVRTLIKPGIGSMWVFDCLFNLDQMRWMCKVVQEAGAQAAPQVMFGESPVHTDAFFERIVREMSTWGVETVILGDEAGVLTAERALTWVPAMVAAAGDTQLEAHFHNTTGLSTLNYITAARAGVHILHTAGPGGGRRITRVGSAAYVVDAVRTPFGRGRPDGALAAAHPVDLLADVLTATVARTGVDPAAVDDVLVGCVQQVAEQAGNIGRHAVFAAGWPWSVLATTLDRECGSFQQSLTFAAQAVTAGAQDLAVVGGVEMMSRVPIRASRIGRDELGPRVRARIPEGLVGQGVSAELVAARWKLPREALDKYALGSHQRAAAARDAGLLDAQIVPVDAAGATVSQDEGIRNDTSAGKLAALRPSYAPRTAVTRLPIAFPKWAIHFTAGRGLIER